MKCAMDRTILLKNTTLDKTKKKLEGFQHRYRYYHSKKYSGCWQCRMLKQDDSRMYIQLVDLIYEPPRGTSMPSEAPILKLTFEEVGNNIVLNCQVMSRNAVLFAICVYILFVVLVFSLTLYLLLNLALIPQSCITTFLFVFLTFVGVRWLQKRIQHNALTLKVFRELLSKNFQVD